MKHNGSMLDPSMGELKAHINNRYLLVNVTARLAREISQKAEEEEVALDNKPVTIALHEIADGEVTVVRDQENVAQEKPAESAVCEPVEEPTEVSETGMDEEQQ